MGFAYKYSNNGSFTGEEYGIFISICIFAEVTVSYQDNLKKIMFQ